jgi:hypothetical protein
MKRLEALEELEFKVKGLNDFLCEYKKGSVMQICDADLSITEIDHAVCSLETLLGWVEKERVVEDEKEEAALPDEGSPGYPIGG